MTAPITLAGTYFPPKQSRAHEASLRLADPAKANGSLNVDGKNRLVTIVSLSDQLAGVERSFTLDDGGTFVTRDDEAVALVTSLKKGWFDRVSFLEKFGPHLGIFVVAIVALMYGMVRYGLPVAAKVAVWATPPELAQVIDTSAMSTLERLFLDDTNVSADRQAKLQTAFSQLVALQEDQRFTPKLMFRTGGNMGPNAFALPAGSIVVTDELAAITNDEEVVAVLAHELAHVEHSHGLEQMYRAFGFAGLVAVFAGDLGAVGEEIIGGGGLLVAMAASREMETHADAEAVKLLTKAGRDPAALRSALNKLYDAVCKGNRKNCDESGWFSSHPGGKERDAALDAAIQGAQ